MRNGQAFGFDSNCARVISIGHINDFEIRVSGESLGIKREVMSTMNWIIGGSA